MLCAGSQAGCATVAWDRQDGDICGSIQVQPSANCAATQNVACATCPVSQLQLGLCIPDTYDLQLLPEDRPASELHLAALSVPCTASLVAPSSDCGCCVNNRTVCETASTSSGMSHGHEAPAAHCIEPECLGCRYVLNYTVTDSLGLSAVPLQLEVVVYESASVQASLLMISHIPYTGAIARAQAHTNTERLTDASASTANTAMRQVTSLLLLVAKSHRACCACSLLLLRHIRSTNICILEVKACKALAQHAALFARLSQMSCMKQLCYVC